MRWFLVLAALLVPACGAADSLPLRQGDPVTILRKDGTRTEARFIGTADEPPRLLLATTEARRWTGWTDEVPVTSIARIEAGSATEFREVRILKGTFLGMIAGGVLAFALHGVEPPGGSSVPATVGTQEFSDDRMTDTVHGMEAGSVLGALVGLLTAGFTRPSRSWTFDELGRPVPSGP